MKDNYIRLTENCKLAISQALHKTIQANPDKISPNDIHKSCFYYANLGADLCTKIVCSVNSVNDYKKLYYTACGGGFSLRIAKEVTNTTKGMNFGAGNPNFDDGNYHLWIVGVVKDEKLTEPCEFIDFTSRYYCKNTSDQGHKWERSDISDYLWLDETQMVSYGISLNPNHDIAKKSHDAWIDSDCRHKMLDQALEIYKKLRVPE